MRKPAGIKNATEVREEALQLHREGNGYKKISKKVGVCENTVKSWIRRHKVKEGQLPQPAKKVYDYICVQCEQAFQGNWNNQRKYCSSACSIKKSERKKVPREKEITVRSANVNLKQAREQGKRMKHICNKGRL